MGIIKFKYASQTLFIAVLFVFFSSCDNQVYTPKPRGYFRIKLPEKHYQLYDTICPFTFQKPTYTSIEYLKDNFCWFNINFVQFNATLHISYKPIKSSSVEALAEDARTFVYKHTVKADAIDEFLINDSKRRVYGIFYDIAGNTASNYQFYLTDSIQHFLRAALYFNEKPNIDSLKPIAEFIKKDMLKMVETLEWK